MMIFLQSHRKALMAILTLAMALCLLLSSRGGRVAAAAEAAWKVLFNGAPSTVKVVQVNNEAVVPVYFPIEKDDTAWVVRVSPEDGHVVKITRTRQESTRLRGGELPPDCRFCSGHGKCTYCYPLGSGKASSGDTCSMCNGTSKCNWCSGTGKY